AEARRETQTPQLAVRRSAAVASAHALAETATRGRGELQRVDAGRGTAGAGVRTLARRHRTTQRGQARRRCGRRGAPGGEAAWGDGARTGAPTKPRRRRGCRSAAAAR